MNELNPCPFCGGKAAIQRESHRPPPELCRTERPGEYISIPRSPVNDGWGAECENCGARGPHEYTKPVQNMEQATVDWHRRPEPTPSIEKAFDLIRAERRRQEQKWGKRASVYLHPLHQLAILTEEVGELAEAINETYLAGELRREDRAGKENIKKEAIQVAAVATAIIESKLKEEVT